MLVTFFGHALRRPRGRLRDEASRAVAASRGCAILSGFRYRGCGRRKSTRGPPDCSQDSGPVAEADRVAGAEAVAGTRATAATELQCTAGVPAYQRRLMEHQRGGFRFIDPDVAGGSGGRAEKSALSIESGRTDRLGHVVSVLWWHWSRRCIR